MSADRRGDTAGEQSGRPLQGRVAIVTGVAHPAGMGAASARALAARGASVIVCDLDGSACQERAQEMRTAGGAVTALQVDVRDEQQVERLIDQALLEHGRLDILHSQAADLSLLADHGDPDITAFEVDLWRQQFETIVLGTMLTCKHAIPAMTRTGGGSIICTSSISGMTGELTLTVYAAAKAAVNQVVRSVAAQWGKSGIRCNAVAPGLVLTGSGQGLAPAVIDQYIRHCSTPYVGNPEDVAEVVAFLASDAARYINGEVIKVDGGFTAHSPMVAEQRGGAAAVGSPAAHAVV